MFEMTFKQKLDWLIDHWCERRAIQPLKYILRAYPSVLAHTDQLGHLLEALRDAKGFCRNELTQHELDCVISSINELDNAMKQKVVS
jgi:hypothetical protein